MIRGALSTPLLVVNRGYLALGQNYTLPEVRLTSGELHGPGTVTVNSLQLLGNFNFLDPGAVVNQGTVTISNQIVIGRNYRFENRGTAVFKGSGNVQLPTGGKFLNAAGATTDIQNNNVIGNLSDTGTFVNEGTLLRTVGTGSTSFSVDLNNAGTFEVRSGSINFSRNKVLIQTAGLTWINGGQLSAEMRINGGVLRAAGDLVGGVPALLLSNDAQLEISAGANPYGLLAMKDASSRYQQSGLCTMNIDIGGKTPGVDQDQLSVINANLLGRLHIRVAAGYTPVLGDEYVVMLVSGTRSNQFNSITSSGLPAGLKFEAVYETGKVKVRVVAGP